MRNKYFIATLTIGFIAGVAYVGLPYVLGRTLQNSESVNTRSVVNKTLLNATSTAGNPSRFASSTPQDISGAKKVQFLLSTAASTTAHKVTFQVYSSADTDFPETTGSRKQEAYQKYTDLVATNGTSPTTADTYFARIADINVKASSTASMAMDLTYGSWRSIICVASTTGHVIGTCKVLIEY